jgi:acetyl esterase/lipase
MRALALAALVSLAGCTNFELALVNGADLANGAYRREADLAYGTEAAQRLDVYVPAARAAGPPRALIVFLHGGRWSSGSKEQYRFVAAGLAERGFVVVVPNYRLYPSVHMDAAAADVARAVAWAERAAARYAADPARIVLMGHSAGAQLAALVANDPRWLDAAGADPVRALVGFAGAYDFLPLTDADLIDYFGPPAHYLATQPVNFVRPSSPPAFLVYGLDDSTVKPRNIRSMADHLRAAGVAVDVHLLPGEDHGSVLKHCARFFRGDDALYAALLRFLLEPPARAPAA